MTELEKNKCQRCGCNQHCGTECSNCSWLTDPDPNKPIFPQRKKHCTFCECVDCLNIVDANNTQ